jgi:hypothetical protein
MGLSPDKTISDHIGAIKKRLNPDGKGYNVGIAADMLVDVVRVGCGFLTAAMRELARAGATVKIRDHNMTSRGKPPKGKTKELADAVAAIAGGQEDFAEIAEDFGWMDDETSLDDALDAIRKAYRDLDLSEAKQVVWLKRKKARETDDAANRVQDFIDAHPEWSRHPHLKLGQIAGLDD